MFVIRCKMSHEIGSILSAGQFFTSSCFKYNTQGRISKFHTKKSMTITHRFNSSPFAISPSNSLRHELIHRFNTETQHKYVEDTNYQFVHCAFVSQSSLNDQPPEEGMRKRMDD